MIRRVPLPACRRLTKKVGEERGVGNAPRPGRGMLVAAHGGRTHPRPLSPVLVAGSVWSAGPAGGLARRHSGPLGSALPSPPQACNCIENHNNNKWNTLFPFGFCRVPPSLLLAPPKLFLAPRPRDSALATALGGRDSPAASYRDPSPPQSLQTRTREWLLVRLRRGGGHGVPPPPAGFGRVKAGARLTSCRSLSSEEHKARLENGAADPPHFQDHFQATGLGGKGQLPGS